MFHGNASPRGIRDLPGGVSGGVRSHNEIASTGPPEPVVRARSSAAQARTIFPDLGCDDGNWPYLSEFYGRMEVHGEEIGTIVNVKTTRTHSIHVTPPHVPHSLAV